MDPFDAQRPQIDPNFLEAVRWGSKMVLWIAGSGRKKITRFVKKYCSSLPPFPHKEFYMAITVFFLHLGFDQIPFRRHRLPPLSERRIVPVNRSAEKTLQSSTTLAIIMFIFVNFITTLEENNDNDS